MAGLTEAEKEEILEVAGSKTIREDMMYLATIHVFLNKFRFAACIFNC